MLNQKEKRNILLTIICLLTSTYAIALDSKDFNPIIIVSVQPYANWSYYSGPFLDYEIKPSAFTSVELGLKYKDWLNLLFGFDYNFNDNFVGQTIDSKAFAKIAGQLGIKNFALKAAFGQVDGTVTWKGPPVPGQPATAVIGTKFYELDLMYIFPIEGFYSLALGLSYINYHVPTSLEYAYADDMSWNYYGVYFQWSNFRANMDKWRTEKENGFSFFIDQYLSAGVAVGGELDEETKRRNRIGSIISADAGGPGISPPATVSAGGADPNIIGSTGFGMTWQVAAGLCGGFNIKRTFLGFGVGYDGFWQGCMTGTSYSSLIRHGCTVKTCLSF